jgi:hypothetical protein
MSRPATPAVLIARLITGALLAAALIVPPGCGAQGASRTNVVLIVLDTLRTDHMSAYGYRWPTDPKPRRPRRARARASPTARARRPGPARR